MCEGSLKKPQGDVRRVTVGGGYCDDDGMVDIPGERTDATQDTTTSKPPAPETPTARPASGVRALVVEDEIALAGVLGSYLEREGFEVHLCHDGGAAVSLARDVDPDVVVLDLGLPGLDGLEVCRQLRTFSDAYVVMLTARDDEVDKLIGLSVGADDYMTKPFSPRELVARVRAMLRRPRPWGPVRTTDRCCGASARCRSTLWVATCGWRASRSS